LLEIAALLDNASTKCRERISSEFDRFGLEIVNFFIESINIPDEDLARVKKTLEDRAEFNLLGDERYTRKRSFDVLETGAGNSGTGGSLMGAGLGLGLGFGAVSTAGGLARQLEVSPATPAQVRCPKCEKQNPQGTRFCADCGEKLATEKLNCPSCQSENLPGAKFCHQCGIALSVRKCSQCGNEIPAGGKFCGNCGKSIEG
jgi:membrane protease subunit (stomatin/prohibitin family)